MYNYRYNFIYITLTIVKEIFTVKKISMKNKFVKFNFCGL